MPATKKVPAKRPAPPQPTKTPSARSAQVSRTIDRVAKALEAAQKDLTAIGGSLGEGTDELRKDVAKLLRDARRDVAKMSKAVRRDLEHLQKDLSVPRRATSRRARPAPSSAKSASAPRKGRKGA
jgi:ABC-type transporter Mla subunit MlaD